MGRKKAAISRGRDGTPDAYKTLFLEFETLNAELQTVRFSALLLTENAVAFSACSPSRGMGTAVAKGFTMLKVFSKALKDYTILRGDQTPNGS